VCGKSAISRLHLKLHEEVHIPVDERKFACDKCDKKFVNNYNLNAHKKMHTVQDLAPTIPCTLCDKKYKTEAQLKAHTDFCHNTSRQSWICYICSKVLKTKSNLDFHIKAHVQPDDPIECDLCGHIIKNKRRFAIHMAKHRSAENGPYECEQGCGKIFRHRSAMQAHILFVHTKNRFVCEHCGKEFKHKKALKEHEASMHTGIDLYSCDFCERSFKSGANMHAHRKKAHPEEHKKLPAPSYLRGNMGDYE
jgi:Zinc finger, C2H2 type/Zinc-finger of C2H2 type